MNCKKSNNNEFIRFLRMTKGSIGEVRNQLYIGLTLDYINKDEFNSVNTKLENLAGQVGGLIVYLDKNRQSK